MKSKAPSDKSAVQLNQWEEDYILANWGTQALFYEYLEMVLQFGFGI